MGFNGKLGTSTGVWLGSQLESWEPEGECGVPNWKVGNQHVVEWLGSQLESWEPEAVDIKALMCALRRKRLSGCATVKLRPFPNIPVRRAPRARPACARSQLSSWERDNTRNFISQTLYYDVLLHQCPIMRIDLMRTCHSKQSEEAFSTARTLWGSQLESWEPEGRTSTGDVVGFPTGKLGTSI